MRQPIERDFVNYHKHRIGIGVTIVDVGAFFLAYGIRGYLEGHPKAFATRLISAAGPNDFLKALETPSEFGEYMVITGHGDWRGIFWECGQENRNLPPLKDGQLAPEWIAKANQLPATIVLALFCGSGEREMAQAFLKGSIKSYIGSVYPYGDVHAVPLFVASFFHGVLWGKSPRDAWLEATRTNVENENFVFYEGNTVTINRGGKVATHEYLNLDYKKTLYLLDDKPTSP